jgi:L-amino acid N-acyltransferase YncA
MAVYTLTRYPQELRLRDGTCLEIRPMTADDVDTLLTFFLQLPEEERFLLKEDVTSRDVVQHWADGLDYDRALPLLALENGQVVADVVLLRHRGNARSHTGEIRITVDPRWRGRGLGVGLMRELLEIAYDAELEFVLFELVREAQQPAIDAAVFLGALEAGSIEAGARDSHGHPHDLVFLKLPLGKSWEWSRF